MSDVIGELDAGERFRGMKLVKKQLADLIPNPNNVKLHPDHQVADIARSIQSSGFCDPITIDEHNNMIDGHGRRLALMSLGIEEVPCIVLPINPVTGRAYGIAHNQTTLSSSFDYLKLREDIEALGITNDDLVGAGFDRDSLRLMHNDDMAANLEAVKSFKEDTSTWKGLADKVYKFDLDFINEDDQYTWSNFLIRLRQLYPQKDTISDRIMQYIEDNNA